MSKRSRRLLTKNKLKFVLSFLLRFNLLAIPLYLVIYSNFSFQPLQTLIAQIITGLLKAQNYNIIQNNDMIITNINDITYNIEVSWDSTGWKSLYALFALVMAVPASNIKSKLRFLSVGLPAIFMLNLIRVLTTILIAINYGFQYFDVVHTLLWREGLIIAVVLLWYFWLAREKHNIRQK
ncbi:MAG: exosortase/archaeosortase family protein [Candidatus Aenigmarchaeota archaeon]|nr:exosortase/archaeosortase family protein [Candidatus Aenigmarchaeota archaeon]